jgi:glucose/arabinose dehydrogenase
MNYPVQRFRRGALIKAVVWLAAGCSVSALAQPVLPPGFTHQIVADGLAQPTSMAFAPDGRLFYCEQGGRVRVIKDGLHLETPFIQVVTANAGESGLLGIAFDPGFSSNQFLYLYYTVPDPDRHNRVSRVTANGDTALAGSELALLEIDRNTETIVHQGGALHFGPDGKLYIAVGEHFGGSQSLSNHFGKILRINSNGTIPQDNPFYTTTTGTYRSIWAYGLRQPFTFAFHPITGRMLINEVGSSNNEELNEGEAGANYGWPFLEGPAGIPGYKDPIYWYRTSPQSCAIVGAVFYNPSRALFPAEYVGNYFFGDLCGLWIRRMDSNNIVRNFITGLTAGPNGGPVDLDIAPDGSLYVILRAFTVGRIVRIGRESRLVSLHRSLNGRVDIQAVGATNHPHILEFSANLIDWQSIATNSSTNGELTFTDELPASQRFYRLKD